MRKTVSTRALFLLCVMFAAVIAGCYSTQVSSGILYDKQDNHVKAERMFREALWYNQEEAAAHHFLAVTLCKRAREDMADGQVDSAKARLAEAHERFLRAAELEPEEFDTKLDGTEILESNIQSNYAYYFNRAVEFNRNGQIDQAVDYFDLAYCIDPRGEAGFDAKNFSIKLRMNEVSQLDPDDPERDARMTGLLAELDELKPANSEQKADWTNTKANALTSLGRGHEAAVLYEQLLADNPNDIALLNRVAQIRITDGDREGGAELYERIIALVGADPDMSKESRFNYYYAAIMNLRDMEKYPEVITLSEEALTYAATPDQEYLCYLQMARSHYQLEEWQLAIERAERAISLKDDQAAIWQIYYLSLSRDGRTDDAQEARRRWSELNQQQG